MKTLRFIGFLIVVSFIGACSIDNNDNYCFQSGQMATTAVAGPETTTVNTAITLNVTFRVSNDCGTFNRFLESNTGFPKSVVAQVDYSGCHCTDTPDATQTKPYTFTATAAGTYELRFLQENGLYITKVITVTE